MKKLSFLMFALAATMMLSAQTFKVTWNLDGGATNQYGATNKSELFNAFVADCGITLPADVTLESLMAYAAEHPDNPCKTPGGINVYLTKVGALALPQWAWLKTYLEGVRGATYEAGTTWNYEVGAFWIANQNPTWPVSSDYTEKGKDEAYTPAMNAAGQYYAYPAEVAADYVLPTPFKTGYSFLGWYDGETKVEAIAADVELTAKWEAVKYNVTWDLDGGKLLATNKSELFNAFVADCGITLPADVTLESLMAYAAEHPDNPCKDLGIGKYLTKVGALALPQWAWLKAYLEGVKGSAYEAGSTWNYEVGAFWIANKNTTWPASSDYTELGKDEAYTPAMNAAGIYYELPAQFSIDMILPTPLKTEHSFLGWYNGTSKVEAVDADMALVAKWERNVYIVDFVAPFAFPNNMYADDVYELAYALQEDYNAAYSSSKAWAKMVDGQVYFNIGGEWKLPKDAQGQETTVTGFIQASTYNTTDNLKKLVETEGSKWAWVKDAVVAQRTAAGLSTDVTEALYRKEISAMFLASPANGSWPGSSAWTNYTADSIAKAWGGILALPDTIAEDYTLPTMYRKNYTFDGWYWEKDFSGAAVTVVPVKSNGTLYAKFTATEFALLGIELSKKDTVELQMPATDSLYVIYTPETAANKKVTWSSSDTEVLVVEQNGKVTPKAPGVATVKVVSDESELVATVVYNVKARVGAVTGVTLDKTELTLALGETATLVATVAPEDAVDKSLVWTSNGKAVSVDSVGVIKADTVGTATITVTTVDGGYTATCKVTVPEPINADVKVEKLWEVAIDNKVANSNGDCRVGMGYDGIFYVTDKGADTQKIRVFTKDGEDVEAAITLNAADMVGTHDEMTITYDTVIVGLDTTITADTTIVPVSTTYTLGTAIALDNAGNIVFGTNFPNNVNSLGIIKKGEKKPTIIEVNLPQTGRTDQITAFGDIFSEEGGLVALYPTGATQVQLVKIANGQLVEVKELAGEIAAGKGQSQVIYATETEAITAARSTNMQYVKDGVVTTLDARNYNSADIGGARMVIGGAEVIAYPATVTAGTHTATFHVRNMTAGQFAADKDGNTVHYIIDTKSVGNSSYANLTREQKINDYAYYLNVYTPGKGAALFKVYQEVAVESIALDQATATVKAGEKLQLTATITPSYATVQDVVWSTSDSTIAIVDQNGLVQAVKAGEATITATTVDGGKVAECALTVKAVYYHRAMSVAELKAGKKMLIVNAGDTLAMAQANKNNFGQVAIAPEDGLLSDVPASATIITIEQDSVFAFAVEGGYIYAGTSSSNYLRIQEQRDELAEWDITIDENGLATIVCHSSKSKRNTIRYNKQSEIFSAYAAGTQEDVVIFVEYEKPDYMPIDDEITNLSVDMDNLILYGGPSTGYQVEVVLGLAEDNMDGTFALSPASSVTVMGQEATFVRGYAYDIDIYAPAAKALVVVDLGGQRYGFNLTMSAAKVEAIDIVIEDATLDVKKIETFPGMYEYSLEMTANWTDAEGVTYPVLVEVPVYYPESVEPYEIMTTVTVGSWDEGANWLGFGEGYLTISTVDGVVTAQGLIENAGTGFAANITISGKLQITALENIEVGVKPIKVIKNGQLFIIRGDVEYNAQGQMVK